ncbi:UPF0577 protein KIAA1324-like protein [Dinothrombium tinctorium]|uniref:UPF0577 protein KIAA1324-like protein n=1 Tax=Dinothrombium tinctorium TaxID=1965070 RepID=A0A443RHS6_9ACAR|nr:UPF0577 protein KIAA1324-like protein [Dinothrombium tinctorium]
MRRIRRTLASVGSGRTEALCWEIRDSMVEFMATNLPTEGCMSVFSYTVKIVKKGKLKFNYQYILPDEYATILFTFQYRNYEDAENRGGGLDSYNIKFPSVTHEHQKWDTMELVLRKPGLYVFIWKSVLISNMRSIKSMYQKRQVVETSSLNSGFGVIRIKSIEVLGVAYTSECTPCEPGSFAAKNGSSFCQLCPRDTYNPSSGSTECKKCSPSQYSPPGSKECFEKPECNENDYYEIFGECDEHKKKQRITIKPIEPKICRDNNTTSSSFTRYQSCNSSKNTESLRKDCSPGMELINNTCRICPENYYNDGFMDKCHRCPASTLPDYSLVFDTWHYPISESPLSRLSSQCIFDGLLDSNECDSDAVAWKMTPATKSYIRSSSHAVLNSYLFLTLSIDGFRSNDGGELTFSYQINCITGDTCHFIFVEITEVTEIIQEWKEDTHGIRRFKYSIRQNSSMSLGWIFKRKVHLQSHARIYDIILTNVMGSGAFRCKPCPHGAESACVPCPKGYYFGTEIQHIHKGASHTHIQEKKCLKCPQDTIINDSISFPVGKETCIKCGPGLRSNEENTACYSNCRFVLEGDLFDLSQIKQPLFMKGSSLFTSGGTQYYHYFNITLCGLQKSVCSSNISSPLLLNGQSDEVRSMICRSTIFPDINEIHSTQPVRLGDELIAISKSTTYRNISVHPEFSNVHSDIHLYYITQMSTIACKDGRTLVITLRCAPNIEQDAVLSSPKSCPYGTCDGCNFHLMIQTKAACRICKEKDYETVVGECKNGLQEIHYINPKACIISQNDASVIRQRPCSVIPRQVQLVIMIVSFFGVILLAMVFHFWKKNRRLEYKYSKLVENKNTAECCAEDDDEDDEEEVKIRQPKKERSSRDNGYETIQLTKQSDNDEIM